MYLQSTNPGAYLTLHVTINLFKALILINTGVFMHYKFEEIYNAITRLKDSSRNVWVIDGRVINFGLITHQARVELFIKNHHETLLAEITNTRHYAWTLGMPWLVCHDPTIRWSQRQVTFASFNCQ